MATIARWALVPIASVSAWYLALFIGIVLLVIAESTALHFCSPDEVVSDQCHAPWFLVIQAGIFCISTALSAVFVVAAAYFAAPHHRTLVAWLAFAIGTVTAIVFAVTMPAWNMGASAIAAGLATAAYLSHKLEQLA
jgi:hypothetical protein